MIALVFLIVAGIGAFVAIVLAQAALNRRLTRSENAGGWAGPIIRAVLPGNAFEVGVPWRAIALVAALLVGVFVVIPRIGGFGGSGAAASSGAADCRQVMVLTPDHPEGVLVERCGPEPVPEVVYPDGRQAPVESPAAPAAAPVAGPARSPAPISEPATPSAAGPPTVRLAPGEIVAASGSGVMIGNPQHWSRTDAAGVVIACAGQGCSSYPTGWRVTR